VFTFAAIFFTIFFASLTQRSILYNIFVSLSLLIKVLLGIYFYSRNSTRSLRLYFLLRYLYNALVVLPIIVIFKFYSPTYTLNYFMTIGILLISEIIITAVYCKHLCFKKQIENFEEIPGCKILRKDNIINSL
jgi:hypothetical protein